MFFLSYLCKIVKLRIGFLDLSFFLTIQCSGFCKGQAWTLFSQLAHFAAQFVQIEKLLINVFVSM